MAAPEKLSWQVSATGGRLRCISANICSPVCLARLSSFRLPSTNTRAHTPPPPPPVAHTHTANDWQASAAHQVRYMVVAFGPWVSIAVCLYVCMCVHAMYSYMYAWGVYCARLPDQTIESIPTEDYKEEQPSLVRSAVCANASPAICLLTRAHTCRAPNRSVHGPCWVALPMPVAGLDGAAPCMAPAG